MLWPESGKPIPLMDAERLAWAMAQPTTTTCGLCGETFQGNAGEGMEWHRAHRKTEHGLGTHRRKYTVRSKVFNGEGANLDENIAAARLAGSDVDYGDDDEDVAA